MQKMMRRENGMFISPDVLQLSEQIADIPGLLGETEGPYLYSLARLGSKLGCVVEIGSWKGKSTIWLAKGSLAVGGGKVYAIDPHPAGANTEKELSENIKKAGVESIVVPLVTSSIEALRGWNEPIGLLWIDGDHKYRGVQSDFLGWYPHVVEGGIIALHDTINRRAVKRFVSREVLQLFREEKVRILAQVEEILAVKKIKSLSRFDRSKRKMILWLEYHFRRNHCLARDATNRGKLYLRSGDYEKAREYFWSAFFYQALYWKNLRRLILSYLPRPLVFYIYQKTKGQESSVSSMDRGKDAKG